MLARTGLLCRDLTGIGSAPKLAPSLPQVVGRIHFLVVVKLMALVSSQPAKESQAGWAGAVLLGKYVQVITCSDSPSPLLHPIGEKQVTCLLTLKTV